MQENTEIGFDLNEVNLLLLGFEMIGEPQDHYTSFRKPVLGTMEFAWYREDKFLRLQTTSSGITIKLEHIKTIEQFVNLYEALTGKSYSVSECLHDITPTSPRNGTPMKCSKCGYIHTGKFYQ